MEILVSIVAAAAAYVLIKLATKNGRGSTQPHVQHSANLRFEFSHSLINYLNLQLNLFRDPEGGTPEHARDSYSIGYIFGTVDAALQYKKITTITQYEILIIVLPQLFGNSYASDIFDRAIALIENGDPEYLEGCNTGGNEFFDAADGRIRNSLSWLMHLQKKQSEI